MSALAWFSVTVAVAEVSVISTVPRVTVALLSSSTTCQLRVPGEAPVLPAPVVPWLRVKVKVLSVANVALNRKDSVSFVNHSVALTDMRTKYKLDCRVGREMFLVVVVASQL